jgi:hypothetical protein
MATEEDTKATTLSLADRITERRPDDEEMEIDEETKDSRHQALLDGPLEPSYGTAESEAKQDLEMGDKAEGGQSEGLLNRIAKNRLYTVNETAPDVADTRVPKHVSFLSFPLTKNANDSRDRS